MGEESVKKGKRKKKLKKLFPFEIPDLSKCIGQTIVINGKPIRIDTCVGNLGMTLGRKEADKRPQYAEINGKYRISFLRLFAQIEGAHDITEEQFKQFEETEFHAEPVEKKHSEAMQ